MEQKDIWQRVILPTLERKFPNSLIGTIKEIFPEKDLVYGADHYVNSEEEVLQFFQEYQYFCWICQPDSAGSLQNTAISAIVRYFIGHYSKIPPLWAWPLSDEIQALES